MQDSAAKPTASRHCPASARSRAPATHTVRLCSNSSLAWFCVCATSSVQLHYPQCLIFSPRRAVKHCVKLRTTRAYREACGKTLVVGTAPVAELADGAAAAATEDAAEPESGLVETLFLAHDADAPDGLVSANVLRVSPAVLAKLAGVQSAAGDRLFRFTRCGVAYTNMAVCRPARSLSRYI